MGESSQRLDCQLHVFISDDGSPDFSEHNLRDVKLGRVQLHHHRTDSNVGEAANVKNAIERLLELRVEWFILLHQDDALATVWLQYCAAYTSGIGRRACPA